MKRQLFAYFDHVTLSYRNPFINDENKDIIAKNIERSIKFNLETNNLEPIKGLQSCSLFDIGFFDDETGSLISNSEPILVIDCRLVFSSYGINHETKNVN